MMHLEEIGYFDDNNNYRVIEFQWWQILILDCRLNYKWIIYYRDYKFYKYNFDSDILEKLWI